VRVQRQAARPSQCIQEAFLRAEVAPREATSNHGGEKYTDVVNPGDLKNDDPGRMARE
jgi:hypothetical protein